MGVLTMKESNKQLYKKLSRSDMCQLINLFAKDIQIYIGMYPYNMVRSAELNEITPCVMNGELIQINSQWTLGDDVIPVNEWKPFVKES